MFSISSGKAEVDSRFPTETNSFLGLSPSNIQFRSTGETESVSLLLDGNSTIYPVVKDSTPAADSIKDPSWLDLMPIASFGKHATITMQSRKDQFKSLCHNL